MMNEDNMTNGKLPDMFFVRSYDEKDKKYHNSETLLGVGYDESNRILYLIFRRGRNIYRYLEVPKEHFDVIKDQTAKISKGGYLADEIKIKIQPQNTPRYEFVKIKPFEGKDSDLIDYHENFGEAGN